MQEDGGGGELPTTMENKTGKKNTDTEKANSPANSPLSPISTLAPPADTPALPPLPPHRGLLISLLADTLTDIAAAAPPSRERGPS